MIEQNAKDPVLIIQGQMVQVSNYTRKLSESFIKELVDEFIKRDGVKRNPRKLIRFFKKRNFK